ncbi:MAG TPA: Fic family protein [Blastocatellia bacterium]|nr:Fic family protein [Blastocatellia bacterium]
MKDYKWRPIEDLPENWPELAAPELPALSAAWQIYSEKLRNSDSLKHFNERLTREWAIETGIIENLYSIDRGVTQTLIEKGIGASLIPHGSTDKPVERILPILKDQQEVVEGLFDFVAQRRELSTSYIKQLHQALTRHQETTTAVDGLGRVVDVEPLRGEWKRLPNNPTRPDGGIHEYSPPDHVASEVDRLIVLHQEHQQKSAPPEIEAAWLHHRFAQIHPFQDGNGRVVRALASVVFIRAGWFPLVVNRDDRVEYIESLEQADHGDLAPLVNLFARIQKKAFNQALSLSEQVILTGDPLQQIIAAATERLKERKRISSERFALSHRLEEFTKQKLVNQATILHTALNAVDSAYTAGAMRNNEQHASVYQEEAKRIAREIGYLADSDTYHAWCRLSIHEKHSSEIVVSFHSMGAEFLELMAISAWIRMPELNQFTPLSRTPFQFSLQDEESQVTERLDKWLDDVLLVGLDLWRKQL